METIEAIHTRRSVRAYTDKKVEPEKIHKMLAAAMTAPSAGNQQPWQFLVIDDKGILAEIPDMHPYASMAKHAAGAIIVLGDAKLERLKGFWVQDCAAATQNMLLAAHTQGIGAVWCGIYPDENRVKKFREHFQVPATVTPLSMVVFGYPDEPPKREDRYREDRVHHNKW